jgi:hypothetical protein
MILHSSICSTGNWRTLTLIENASLEVRVLGGRDHVIDL